MEHIPDILGVKTRPETDLSWSMNLVMRRPVVSHSKMVPLTWPVAKKTTSGPNLGSHLDLRGPNDITEICKRKGVALGLDSFKVAYRRRYVFHV